MKPSILNLKLLAISTVLGAMTAISSAQVSVTGVNGTLSAEADFSIVGTGSNQQLLVTLTNTSHNTATGVAQCLSGLFFNFATGYGLGAAVGANDDVRLSTAAQNPDHYNAFLYTSKTLTTGTPSQIDSGYGFLGNLNASAAFGSAFTHVYGFSSAGIGLFGAPNFAQSTGNTLDGADYSLLPDAAFNPTLDGFKNSKSYPLVKNSVTFTVHTGGGWNQNTLNHLANVGFNYGTALGEGMIGGGHGRVITPEPVTTLLGLAGAGLFIRRRFRSKKS